MWHHNHKEQQRQYLLVRNKFKIKFLGKRLTLDHNPRVGLCSRCGFKGVTVLHHKRYIRILPLLETIELCAGCHSKVHAEVRAHR